MAILAIAGFVATVVTGALIVGFLRYQGRKIKIAEKEKVKW